MNEQNSVRTKIINLLKYNLNLKNINNDTYNMTLKVYDKTKSLFSVIDYIIEILLEISNNYLNLINAFTNKGKSNSLNYCQKEVIPKFEKMLIILNYFNMVDKYEKELELIGKNRDISISNKFLILM